jgi:hypothetical protein
MSFGKQDTYHSLLLPYKLINQIQLIRLEAFPEG